MITERQINEVVARIAKNVNPQKVILFARMPTETLQMIVIWIFS